MADSTEGLDKHYSDQGFWDKVKRYGKVAGREAIEKALLLYFAMQDPQVPAWAKGIVAGALGYFIFPIDAIPDVLVPLGYTDDVGVMAAALAAIAVHLTPETKKLASDKVAEWFGAA